jgi:diguanylate cyclase (GGDEF)-like protein
VDLDRLKLVNDGFGHELGDRLLKAVADRLRDELREADTIARFGGDEFAVVVEDLVDETAALRVGERIVAALAKSFAIEGEEISIGASVGITVTRDRDRGEHDLLREADVAMYRVKARGGDGCALFDSDMRRAAVARVRIERELRHALEGREFSLVYQPLISIRDGVAVACEALLRWQPSGGVVRMPGDFIPLAEETGLIVPVGEWVLDEACRQAHAWRSAGRDLGISVNVSARQLARHDFVDLVRNVLAHRGLPAPSLCLEITETAIVEQPEHAARVLEALKNLGVRIAIDDFGRGFSSLSHFRSLPIDVIKIDRSFVADLGHRDNRAIVSAVMSLGAELGMSVVAEGVETDRQHSGLVELGCPLAQGYLYARPCPPDELAHGGFLPRGTTGIGDPFVIREFMRQIGIPARLDA